MRSFAARLWLPLLACVALHGFCGHWAHGEGYKFVLFWPKTGISASADAQFQGVFRDTLVQLCAHQGATLPADFSVSFEEFLMPEKPSYSLLVSYSDRLKSTSTGVILFAGTTSVDAEARSHLASLVAPRPLHWVDPPKLSDLTLSLFHIIRIMQRPDLANDGSKPAFAPGGGTAEESEKLAIVAGPPYRLSDVKPLVQMFAYGVRCFEMNPSVLDETLSGIRDSRVTTILVLANRSSTRHFLDAGLEGSLWSPDYRWILYDSALVNDVKPNLMPANSRNITSVEFGSYKPAETKFLKTTEEVMLYDLLSIWTAFLANLTCRMPIAKLNMDGLTGQFNLSANQTFVRHNWQMSIYGNLLTNSIMVGNFSTSGSFSMIVPKPRSSERDAILSEYSQLNLTMLVIPGSQYVRYKQGMENRTDLPMKQRLEGMSFDLCMEIFANLGLKNFSVLVQADEIYGAKDKNGDWNGIVGSLINGVGDIACVDLTPTSARSDVIDFSVSYFTSNLSILYKQNPVDTTKEMFQFMFPFSTATWFYLLGALLAVALVLALLHRISPSNQLFDLRYSLFFSFASLVQGIVGSPPDRPSGRIVVCAYWLFVLILLVSYVANYAAMRTLAHLEVDITTVASLLEQTTYTYGTLSNSSLSSVFTDSTFSDMHRVYEAMRRFPNGLFTDLKVAEEAVKAGTFAVVFDTPTNMYLQQLICNSVVTGNFENTITAFGLPQRSDLKPLIDAELQKLLSSGRVDQLYNKYFVIAQSSRPNCATNPLSGAIPTEPTFLAPRSGALTLHNTLGLLVINVIGCCLTLIAATFERSCLTLRGMRARKREESMPPVRRVTIAGLFRRESRL